MIRSGVNNNISSFKVVVDGRKWQYYTIGGIVQEYWCKKKEEEWESWLEVGWMSRLVKRVE